jgi:hypothetical protein
MKRPDVTDLLTASDFAMWLVLGLGTAPKGEKS